MDSLEIDVLPETSLADDLALPDLEDLVAFVLRQFGASGSWNVAIVLTDDPRLRALHRDFMGVDTETDVMTFPSAEEDDPSAPRGGDIVISVERAAAQAAEEGWSTEEEVCFLVVHGLLHLLGWRDTTPEEREAMLGRQTDLLRAYAAAR